MKRLVSIFGGIILFFVSIFILNYSLEKNIDKFYSQDIPRIYGNTVKDKGVILQKESLNKNNLIIYGSSELGVRIDQNPSSFFPNRGNKFIVDLIGRGHCQSLKHGINFGALGKELNNRKGAFVVSLQWFVNSGIESDKFLMNFSEIQFYNIMNNKQIKKETKKKICNRVYSLIKEDKNFKDVSIYCKLYKSDNPIENLLFIGMKPYYKFKELIARTEDNIKSYKLVMKYKNKDKSKLNNNLKDIQWNKEYYKAEQQGKRQVNNNQFYIYNEYFNKYYKNKLKELKNSSQNTDILNSGEFEDLNLMLDICKDINFKPVFILMPTNGKWYDYIGINKDKRIEFYKKVSNIIRKKGFEVYSYEKYEYEPYFMKDGMHLGWKGWLTVDETISKYYKKDKR
ncbi:D-alanyl-lipoteichoic acid biosynthesis protein DltD [Clostridium combesii]|uniref:Protein DltD n=1 Tax=Clostridium combesii TaxID=39481 RepID=A0A2G7H745_9CLOT|nr:D-alanyl-lipoteichoic acid biosynthesis protein DltD [Clostridium combesii]PIH00927.1 D-alanyl-lipoteichoic acid biosynthesis protein DltD [Clostridium combesii]